MMIPLPTFLSGREGSLALQPAFAHDRPFLFAVYASSREEMADVAERHPDSRRALLEHEFDARERGYPVHFPGMRRFIVRRGPDRLGRMYLQSAPAFLFLVDLVLLPGWRGLGHGTALLRGLAAHAAETGRPVRLHVEKSNQRAAALYARLGFQVIGEETQHWLMERATHHGE